MTTPTMTKGPLTVSAKNPRYFTPPSTTATGRAVYLTGSHIWNNLHDGMGPGAEAPAEPERLRLRRATCASSPSAATTSSGSGAGSSSSPRPPAASYHLNMTPQPWARTGPGTAKDGKPRFDLERFDDGVLRPAPRARRRRRRRRHLRRRDAVRRLGAAPQPGARPHRGPPVPRRATTSTASASTSIDDLQVLPLDPRVQALQEAYIRKVVDTVHDLPNVLWEVANESSGDGSVDRGVRRRTSGMARRRCWGDSTEWQYWVIDVVKRARGRARLRRAPDRDDDAVPGRRPDQGQRAAARAAVPSGSRPATTTRSSPTAATRWRPARRRRAGSPTRRSPTARRWSSATPTTTPRASGDALWAWKSFLRGHHPILMDFGLIDGLEPTGAAKPDDRRPRSRPSSRPATRWATRAPYAERMSLVDIEPRRDVASTGYALVEPRAASTSSSSPTVTGHRSRWTLDQGRYAVEWFDVSARATSDGDAVTVDEDRPVDFRSPFSEGPAVLYLSRLDS